MSNKFLILLLVLVALEVCVAPPVDQKKKDDDKPEEIDDFGLEYGRYLQQVVQALEQDKVFAKKLENISSDQIRSGHIAKELEFVKHNVRSKLDELKRMEVERLRKLIQEQMERTELGLNRKGVKIPKHLDIENPLSFEIDDLKKLIQTATNDLEELDKQRREEFKKYELEKEAAYRESLKNMTEEQRKEAEKHHEELIEKHKDHPKMHHPGSKPQLEQVWEDQDHMPKEEFNPKTFFAMHDINGDGHLDVEEVEAILIPEVKKLYNPNNEEDDPAEMEEEFHRMREHVFNETDNNRDGLISLEEFLRMTEQQEWQKDEGWKGLDEQNVYSDTELEEFMRQRQMQMQQGQYYGDPRMYYDVDNAQHGYPPQVPPGGVPQGYPQGHPQQFAQHHPQQFQPGHPQQFAQPHPQQFQQGHPQQQYQQGHPQQQFQQGHPQQQFQQGHPQQQQFQQGHPQQQQFQQGHPHQQQYHQQHPHQQQFHQGHPQQQQFQQGHPQQQQFQQGHPQQQQFQQGQQQQFQQGQQGHPQKQQFQPAQQLQVPPGAGHPPPQQQQHKQIEVPLKAPQHQPQANVVKHEQKVPNTGNEIPNADVKPVKIQESPSPVVQQV